MRVCGVIKVRRMQGSGGEPKEEKNLDIMLSANQSTWLPPYAMIKEPSRDIWQVEKLSLRKDQKQLIFLYKWYD